MPDDRRKIPAWQHVASSKPDDEADGKSEPSQPSTADPTASEDLLFTKEVDQMPPVPTREEAKRFLEHPGTKNATLDDKIRFLEVKSVRQEDIEALIPEAKSNQTTSNAPGEESQSGPPALRDVPPVVTYPEFLIKHKRPAPLITTNVILNTLYGTVGAAASMYALSKYVLAPMHEALSESRHDLFLHASSKVDDLNTRLGGMITKMPAPKMNDKLLDDGDNVSVSSDESDPTELFHRDIGVQTSPQQSRRGSQSSAADSLNTPTDPITTHENRLKALSMHIRDLNQSRAVGRGTEQDVKAELTSFSAYLNDLLYSSPYYGYKGSTPSWSRNNPQDEYERFKAEIRSTKGVLLSTRNFPKTVSN